MHSKQLLLEVLKSNRSSFCIQKLWPNPVVVCYNLAHSRTNQYFISDKISSWLIYTAQIKLKKSTVYYEKSYVTSSLQERGSRGLPRTLECNSHPVSEGQGFNLPPLNAAVVWTTTATGSVSSITLPPALSGLHLPPCFFLQEGQIWLVLPCRVILGHKQHLLSFSFFTDWTAALELHHEAN